MTVVDIPTYANGLPRGLTDATALDLVRELAALGGRVTFSAHARRRMQEREISSEQVLNVLRRGEIAESVRWDATRDNYRLSLRALTAGDEVTVACAIEVEMLMGQVVTIVTVMACRCTRRR